MFVSSFYTQVTRAHLGLGPAKLSKAEQSCTALDWSGKVRATVSASKAERSPRYARTRFSIDMKLAQFYVEYSAPC